jgi:hypothetical protein
MISNAHTLSIRFLVLIATVTFVFAGETAANAADVAALQERAQRGDVDAQIDLAQAYMDTWIAVMLPTLKIGCSGLPKKAALERKI